MSGRLVIVGLGLIGASVAAAARERRHGGQIVGWDNSPAAARAALDASLVDCVVDDAAALRAGDLVLLAVPPSAVPSVFAALAQRSGVPLEQLVISDCASVKVCVVEAALDLFGRMPPTLIPGHPLAGSERSGAAAADAALFDGHRVVLCPAVDAAPAALARVETLWRALGAEPVRLDAAEHDELLARTSHLPHVAARALSSVGAKLRIATSNPSLWRDIEHANRAPLAAALRDHHRQLRSLARVAAAGTTRCAERFEAAAALCRRLGLDAAAAVDAVPLQRLVAVAVLECLPQRSDVLSYAAGGLRDIAAAAAAPLPGVAVDERSLQRYVVALAA